MEEEDEEEAKGAEEERRGVGAREKASEGSETKGLFGKDMGPSAAKLFGIGSGEVEGEG